MPLLAKEPSIYPDSLLESAEARQPGGQWMVLYTKPRQEKSLARELLRRSISFYLPLVKKNLQYGRRTMQSFVPLFGGYVFMRGSEADRVASLATNRVLRIIVVGEDEQLVKDLRQIQLLIAANVPLTVESRLTPGMRVRVRKGPMAGVEGTVVKRRGETRLLVSVNFLQQGASVEIDDFPTGAVGLSGSCMLRR